ncbi:MAG: hypothetical protein RL198_875 [Actinomycetota bacterium]
MHKNVSMNSHPHATANIDNVFLDSPIGQLTLWAKDGLLWELAIGSGSSQRGNSVDKAAPHAISPADARNRAVLALAEGQLNEYFSGKRNTFELPIASRGTQFQQLVWGRLAALPFGQTSSYGEIARDIGLERAARAVGGAVGANPIPIIIGCHRILASNRALTGYSGGGGLVTKQWLLNHEGIQWKN